MMLFFPNENSSGKHVGKKTPKSSLLAIYFYDGQNTLLIPVKTSALEGFLVFEL